MLSEQNIQDAVRRAVAAASRPACVWLFGSYARGEADDLSDLDLLVIEDEVEDKADEYLRIHRAIGSLGVGVDVLVFSRREYERRSQVPGTLPHRVSREGRMLHDASS
ncbi:MAG: nucleotidyltransferase domain-containing protein [Pseudomonadota bacterium]|nr:nucleotidyltransferase domain-containing protein [Pseudomonadota bacterium]MDP1903730.1 nucleotidyltransferase domain-containing protein [Pseudomonadota bacterium]MDP2351702.1 nucleotidyltransferase domain-containing protein [Pseudomonadota bacterium]